MLPLLRKGCDGVLNSGLTMGVCGCGEHTGCEDCLGVPHGGKLTYCVGMLIYIQVEGKLICFCCIFVNKVPLLMRLLMLIAYSDSSVIIATVDTLPLTAS